jgi:hypothetical protein
MLRWWMRAGRLPALVLLALSLGAPGRVGMGAGAVSHAAAAAASGSPTALYFVGARGVFSSGDKIAVDNPNPFTATVTLTYVAQGRRPVAVTSPYPPGARARVEVADSAFQYGLGNVSAVGVSSPARIVAAYIRGYGHVAYVPRAAASAGTTLYFAEGYTGGSARTYLTLLNPGRVAAHVTVTVAPQAASAAGALSLRLTLPAGVVVTRDLARDFRGRQTSSFGLIVTADRPVAAERAVRFDDKPAAPFQDDRSDAATAAAGIGASATTLYFPYSSTAGPSFIAVLNPGRRPAGVRARFSDSAGRVIGTGAITVAPGTRGTLDLGAVGRVAHVYATVLTATVPIVAEETHYFGKGPAAHGQPSVVLAGAPAGVTSAMFPDLDLRNPSLTYNLGEPKRQTVYLYNPLTAPITVTATYRAYSNTVGAGSLGIVSKSVAYAVPAGGVTIVDVNRDTAGLVAYPLGNGTLESTLDATFATTGGACFVAAALTAPAP